MKILSLLALLLLSPLAAQAAGDGELMPARWVPEGTYGGASANFTVSHRSATLDLSCAVGTIPYRPVMDEHGVFTVEGTLKSRMLTNPPQPGMPATFTGRFAGQRLWLKVTVHGQGRSIQRLSVGPLELGQAGVFVRCL
jgi:hypothetical protein